MAITVKCPQCSSKLTAPDERAGKRGRCPSCGAIVRIPMAPAPAGAGDPRAAPRADLTQRADSEGGAAKRAVESSGGAGDGGRRARLGLLIGGGVLAAGVVLAVALLRGKETPEPKPGQPGLLRRHLRPFVPI